MPMRYYILESSFSCGQGTHKYVGAAGFLFCLNDKYSSTLPSSVIIQPLVLFNANKNCAMPVATCSL